MDKLMELLNEYEGNKLYFYDDGIYCDKYDMYEVGDSLVELEIISKRYGFIKRLVDNDKIDTRNLENYIDFHNDYKFVANRELKDKYPNGIYTDHLLMLLSIQDSPIEFLVSILK